MKEADDDRKHARASVLNERIASIPLIGKATAPIFGFDELRNRKQLFASAILLKIHETHFALTAAHVLDERSKLDLYVGSGDKGVPLRGSFGSTNFPTSGSRKQDKIDLGIVRLSKEVVRDMRENEFLALDNIDLSVTTTGHYVFAGYPSSTHKKAIKAEEATVALSSFIVDSAPLTDYQIAGLDSNISLALRFDKQNMWGQQGQGSGIPSPTGVSGGGVWRLDDVFATTPLKPLLVAICIKWWEKGKPLKCVLATRMHVALSAIRDHFPELRPYLPGSL